MSELMTKTGLNKAAKKAALRKMFLSPEFNVVDRLNDYDHDYAAVKPLAAGVAETLREWVNKVEELESDPTNPESAGEIKTVMWSRSMMKMSVTNKGQDERMPLKRNTITTQRMSFSKRNQKT